MPVLVDVLRSASLKYSTLYVLHSLFESSRRSSAPPDAEPSSLELKLLELERSEGLWQPWTFAAHRFTTADNRGWWNTHDWSRRGEEWTPSENWKRNIIERFLAPHVPPASVVLEIGPGGGRWTEVLARRARRLCVIDIAEAPLVLCRDRFVRHAHVRFARGDGRTIPFGSGLFDAIWSYDVFVHVNPPDARSYISEFARVLRPGGFAVVHHPGDGSTLERAAQHRSDLTEGMVRRFAEEAGLLIAGQTTELVNQGDVLTILQRPADSMLGLRRSDLRRIGTH